MAHRVQLRSKLMTGLLVALVGCTVPETPVQQTSTLPLPEKLLNKDETQLKVVNGLQMENNIPFSGSLFTIFPGTSDTMELTGYLEGKEHGAWKKFYPSKKIKEIRYFENGRKTGKYIAWWENGQKQLDYTFVADEYEGSCKEWNDEGGLTKDMNYKKGHEEGRQQCWYDNGKIKANYIIKDGRRYGLLGTKNCVNVSDSIFKN